MNAKTMTPYAKFPGAGEAHMRSMNTLTKRSVSIRLPDSRGTTEIEIQKIAHFFGMTKEHSRAMIKLGQSLQPLECAVFVSFRSGAEIRAALQVVGSVGYPPCAAGADNAVARENLKDWVRRLVPRGNSRATVLDVGSRGMAISHLNLHEYGELCLSLSLTRDATTCWAAACLLAG
eukprot:CAMPEP_0202463194 /NCGR_PEP_ID=MMETSP1360-20130828/57127_1 /ASSEMBLY_ACC=CAM_ASM_000848 /TAXON_ID=515479 /ORGANISM="Licmophora paradoxa, Strain CCMP2313" /LENGTH=175 /DNA_ID=CAMNT_0049085989 /DNA_START=59 /DNA_END=583 /DNA_ORIENTATION=+